MVWGSYYKINDKYKYDKLSIHIVYIIQTSLLFFFFISYKIIFFFFFFSSRRRHTRWPRDWSSDVCSSDLGSRIEDRGSRIEDRRSRIERMTQSSILYPPSSILGPLLRSQFNLPPVQSSKFCLRDGRSGVGRP